MGEALVQAARANDIDPFELTAILLETQQGNPQYAQFTSPLQNSVFSQAADARGPQSTGNAGLDYAFGIPRPEWEGFTNQAYLAAGNFRTKAAYGIGDWWKGSRDDGAQAHFEGAQRARYIQEHGDGFAQGALANYNELVAAHQNQHGPIRPNMALMERISDRNMRPADQPIVRSLEATAEELGRYLEPRFCVEPMEWTWRAWSYCSAFWLFRHPQERSHS